MAVHIIGGGVAGLAAAIACVEQGHNVTLYEAAPQLGGRCRSYRYDEFECDLDNGAHAVLANNAAVNRYLRTIGAWESLKTYGLTGLRFVDVRDGAAWHLRLPHAIWNAAARPPGTSGLDILKGAQVFFGSSAFNASAAAIEKLWEPLCTSALNTPLVEADAVLLRPVLRSMAAMDGLRLGLKLPRQSMTQTYISPAEAWLVGKGAIIRTQTPLRDAAMHNNHIERLVFDDTSVTVTRDDVVIVAVPPWSPLLVQVGIATANLSPSPILNVHFRIDTAVQPDFIGLIGGIGQWLWLHNGIASVTVSAADAHMATSGEDVARTIWTEIAPLLGLDPAAVPLSHVVKERRATLRHRLGANAHRPSTQTHLQNLVLAGDWVNTGLPCTLESAMQSGFDAAKLVKIAGTKS